MPQLGGYSAVADLAFFSWWK